MKLCECYVEGFGVLTDFSYKFSDGLSSIVWENGSGKTTLTVFIKVMLYGLDDTRKAKLSENDRKHYMPWSNRACRGSLTFEVAGKKYRVERSFGKKASDDSFALYDLETNLPSRDYSERLGEELFGIDADGFERTLFLSEANLSGKNENKSIAAKLSDLTDSEGDMTVLDDALKLLDKERQFYRKKGGSGAIGDIQEKISEYSERIKKIEDTKNVYRELCDEENSIKEKLSVLYSQKAGYEKELEKQKDREIKQNYENAYREMLCRIEEKKKQEETLLCFFASHLPTQSELDSIAQIELEYNNLSRELKRVTIPSESEVAVGGLDFEALRRDAKELERTRTLAKEKRERLTRLSESTGAAFTNGVPNRDELEEKIKVASLPAGKKSYLPLALALLFIAMGGALMLVHPLLILVALAAVPCFLVFFKRTGRKGEVGEWVTKVTGESVRAGEELGALLNLRERLDGYLRDMKEIETLVRECGELEATALELEGRTSAALRDYPYATGASALDRIELLEREEIRKSALKEASAQERRKYEENAMRATALKRELDEFFSHYELEGYESPVRELRARLFSYESARDNVRRAIDDAEYFAISKGIDKNAISKAESIEEGGVKLDTGALQTQISATERELMLIQQKQRVCEADIDRQEEYEATLDDLYKKERSAEHMHECIENAKKYLTLAHQNLTTKYLGRTKESFLKYVKMIDEECGALDIDTSFSVKKSEGAQTIGAEAYSKGTRDLYALAVRLALVDSLYEKEAPFIILDDPFAYFDDGKLTRALKLIKSMSRERQIIYLSCSGARGACSTYNGIAWLPVNYGK